MYNPNITVGTSAPKAHSFPITVSNRIKTVIIPLQVRLVIA